MSEMIKLEGISRMHIASPNATVVMGCELSVSLDQATLHDCLENLYCSHPLIAKILWIDKADEAFMTDPENVCFDIVEYKEKGYEWITEKQLKGMWKIGGPLVRFIINRLDSGCQLVISANHAISDGFSMVYLLEDIAAYIREPFIPVSMKSTALHPLALRKQFASWPFRFLAFFMSGKWKKHTLQLTNEMVSNIHNVYWDGHEAKVVLLDFDKEKTRKIIECAKRSGASVNTYLTYQLYQSQLGLSTKPYRDDIFISVNLRNQITTQPERQFGYFVTAKRIKVKRYAEKLKAGSLKELHTYIRKKLSARSLYNSLALYFFPPVFFDLIQLNKYNIRQDKSMQGMVSKHGSGIKTAFALTNLGRIEPYLRCDTTLQKFLPLAIVSDTMEKYVSAFTYQGEMQVAICFDPKVIPPADIDSFKTRFSDLLAMGIPVRGQK